MSEGFDVLLFDPGEAEFLAAVQRADRTGHGPPHWQTVFREMAATLNAPHPLGDAILSWQGHHRQLLVAWWTDHRGGLHVRIREGGPANGTVPLHFSRIAPDERPGLWHLCPELIYRVKRGDAPAEWLASCACGVTGRPRELAWMGPRCGPCHDRREEGDPLVAVEPPTLLRVGEAVSDLAFDSTGEILMAALANRRLVALLPDGSEVVLEEGVSDQDSDAFMLIFSPDSRWLAFADPLAGLPILWPFRGTDARVAENEIVPLDLGSDSGALIRDMAFSPNSDHFAACDDTRRARLFRWTGSLWAEVRSLRGATTVAFSEDNQRLAVGGSGGAVRLLSTDSGAQLGQVNTGARSDEDVLFLAWVPGDAALILLTGSDDAERGREEQQLRRWDLLRRRETHYAPFGTPSLLSMSRDGRYLASVRDDDQHSPAAIYFWDLVGWHSAGWIEWDPEDIIHTLAFSPDGETLAIGTQHGRIKLIPWRLLLTE